MVCDGTLPGSPEGVFLESVIGAIPHEVEVVKNHDIPDVMGRLDAELKSRIADEAAAAEASNAATERCRAARPRAP